MDVTDAARATCPRCGADNRCGFGGDRPCWCAAGFEPLLPLPGAAASCYCKACLQALLAQRAADAPT